MPLRLLFLSGMTAAAVVLAGCAGEGTAGPGPTTQAQQLCSSWGYDPNDPECLRTFRTFSP
jgi:hypothetical protein